MEGKKEALKNTLPKMWGFLSASSKPDGGCIREVSHFELPNCMSLSRIRLFVQSEFLISDAQPQTGRDHD